MSILARITTRLTTHRARFRDFQPVVFCVECGSTRIDQNSLTELRCYDCGNTLPWDGTRFSIRRHSDSFGEGDVRRSLERNP